MESLSDAAVGSDAFDEVYEVVKTAEFWHTGSDGKAPAFRIEILKRYGTDNGPYYCSRCFRRRRVSLLAYDDEKSLASEAYVWVDETLPWVHRESEELAMAQSIGWLREKYPKGSFPVS